MPIYDTSQFVNQILFKITTLLVVSISKQGMAIQASQLHMYSVGEEKMLAK